MITGLQGPRNFGRKKHIARSIYLLESRKRKNVYFVRDLELPYLDTRKCLHRTIGLFFTSSVVSRNAVFIGIYCYSVFAAVLTISMIFARVNRLLRIPLANVNSQYLHTFVGNYNLQKRTVRLLKLTLHRYLTGIVDPIHAETRYP